MHFLAKKEINALRVKSDAAVFAVKAGKKCAGRKGSKRLSASGQKELLQLCNAVD